MPPTPTASASPRCRSWPHWPTATAASCSPRDDSGARKPARATAASSPIFASPRGGIGSFVRAIADAVVASGGAIRTGCSITTVDAAPDGRWTLSLAAGADGSSTPDDLTFDAVVFATPAAATAAALAADSSSGDDAPASGGDRRRDHGDPPRARRSVARPAPGPQRLSRAEARPAMGHGRLVRLAEVGSLATARRRRDPASVDRPRRDGGHAPRRRRGAARGARRSRPPPRGSLRARGGPDHAVALGVRPVPPAPCGVGRRRRGGPASRRVRDRRRIPRHRHPGVCPSRQLGRCSRACVRRFWQNLGDGIPERPRTHRPAPDRWRS